MKNIISGILIILIIFNLSLIIKYEFSYKKNLKKLEITVKINNNKGKIGNYEYEISTNCGLTDNDYKLENQGYYNISDKSLSDSQLFFITAGLFYDVEITQISTNGREFIIDVKDYSIDDVFTTPTCIKITENNKYPKITGITIKNQDGIIYNELKKIEKQNFEINDEGILNNTNITYKIMDNCPTDNYDLNKKGYYINTTNQPDSPYYYLITAGLVPNGCYSIKIDNILYDNNQLNINVIISGPSSEDNCNDVENNSHICVELSNINDHDVTVSRIIDNSIYEVLRQLN